MKLYFPKSHYLANRYLLFPLLRPFIKEDKFQDVDRIKLYGLSEKDFEFTDTLEKTDLAILTMSWSHYINSGRIEDARTFINQCANLSKKVLTVNAGDFGMRIPYFENTIVLRSAGYRSKFSKNEYVFPPFFRDPLKVYFDREKVVERSYFEKPVVGFCGQANLSPIMATKEVARTIIRNWKYYLKLSAHEPQQLVSTSFLRASVIKNIQESSELTANFILRKKYHAGVKTNQQNHATTIEFYNNLRDSDYVVCVRGAGNFSIRFYEALAMGRIPVFINTDCALPFDEQIDWKKHVVWVEYKDRSKVAEKVAEFHNVLSEREFIDLQHANRRLWENRLTLNGFFKTFLYDQKFNS